MAIQKEVADHLDISERQVRNLQQSGILPVSKGKGGLNLDDCRKAYINYLRGQKTGQVKKPSDDDDEAEVGDVIGGINVPFQEARKKKLDADTRETRLQILRKEYAPVALLMFSVSRLAEMMVANLNSLPMKMKSADPSISGRSIDACKREIALLCNGLSEYELDLSDYNPVDSIGDSSGVEAPKDS